MRNPPGTPPWLVEALAEQIGVPITAIHELLTADNAAALEEQPQACKQKGWWPA